MGSRQTNGGLVHLSCGYVALDDNLVKYINMPETPNEMDLPCVGCRWVCITTQPTGDSLEQARFAAIYDSLSMLMFIVTQSDCYFVS